MLSRLLRQHQSSRLPSFYRFFATEVAQNAAMTPSSLSKRSRTKITTSVILNRSPIITRSPTSFERAYYAYQARIRRALHNPFPYDFYFKQGSLLEQRFNKEEREREAHAFGPGYGMDDSASEDKSGTAAEQIVLQEGENEELMPRVHAADKDGTLKSLDRKGKRNLYLLLQTMVDGESVWRFPKGEVLKGELLHQAAQRDLHAECGAYMDTWVVGRKPIGFYRPPLPSAPEEANSDEITFFFKAHILAGQVKPQGEHVQDFAWLTKQEVELRVDQEYWRGIRDILSDY